MPRLLRWTRDELLELPWNPFETFEKLVLAPQLRERLADLTARFAGGKAEYHALRLPWRRGIFLFGPAGCGKSAASRAIAQALDWEHFAIPAHEILDSHLFERALAHAVSRPKRVIALEDVDETIRHMEPHVFFTLLDHAMERADATFWVATTRHAESTPKTQLLRPGRFEVALRLDVPGGPLRRELIASILGESADDGAVAELIEKTEGLTYGHFEEIRQVVARARIEGRAAEALGEVHSYAQDQIIAGNRWGGISDLTERVEERVRQVDPRVLTAALDMTDVFRTLLEKVIGDAAARAQQARAQGDGPEASV